MMSDDHPESDQRGLSEQLQAAWARVLESADTFRRVTVGLPERLPRRAPMGELLKKPFRSVAMPSMAGLAWRDQILFGLTGASILVALVTFAIVVSDMLARGTP
jgi:hypothetical protein